MKLSSVLGAGPMAPLPSIMFIILWLSPGLAGDGPGELLIMLFSVFCYGLNICWFEFCVTRFPSMPSWSPILSSLIVCFSFSSWSWIMSSSLSSSLCFFLPAADYFAFFCPYFLNCCRISRSSISYSGSSRRFSCSTSSFIISFSVEFYCELLTSC